MRQGRDDLFCVSEETPIKKKVPESSRLCMRSQNKHQGRREIVRTLDVFDHLSTIIHSCRHFNLITRGQDSLVTLEAPGINKRSRDKA